MFNARRLTAAVGTAALALTLAGCTGAEDPDPRTDRPAPTPSESEAPTESEEPGVTPIEVTDLIATDMVVPWGLAFLPDESALVTERDSGRVQHLTRVGNRWKSEEVTVIKNDSDTLEGGLLGVAVSPDFEDDQEVFLYATTKKDNRVLRGEFVRGKLRNLKPVLTSIPRGAIHDGGRMAFGPDGFLYVSTGDAGEPELAQQGQSLAGKILRIDQDGEPAPDNPIADSPVYSLGHRNVQGLAWDDKDQLWASEFGDDSFDELNKIFSGGNYGWPLLEGRAENNAAAEGAGGFIDPVATWTTGEASPSGLAWADGALWMGALRGTRLWRVSIDPRGSANSTAHFVGEYGRLRTVVTTPDGELWVTTSNRDGRGDPAPDDDQIIQVIPGTGSAEEDEAAPEESSDPEESSAPEESSDPDAESPDAEEESPDAEDESSDSDGAASENKRTTGTTP